MKRAALLLTTLLGCGHSHPYSPADQSTALPFTQSEPLRLTYNIGSDTWAAWSPDGRAIYYSAQDSLVPDKDRCILRLPATGGRATFVQCPLTQAPNRITEVLTQPASNGSDLAFESWELGVDQHSPFHHVIWLAADRPRAYPRVLLDFPYPAPSGVLHNAALNLQWLRPGVLLYLGADEGCCRKDTLRFGEQIVLLDLGGASPGRSFVPKTTRASSVFAARDGASIYYTFYGDSRVYRQVLATAAVTVVYDFGAGRIVRDAQVVGNRLVAIVDGQPRLQDKPPFFHIQIDYGGLVAVVDLAGGTVALLPDRGNLYKRPVLSPDGTAFVVEGYPFVLSGSDTIVSKSADLWLVRP